MKYVFFLFILFKINILSASIEIADVQHITSSCNGSINVTADGSAGPFTFSWTGPSGFSATTEDVSGLCESGYYTVTIGFHDSECSITLSTWIMSCSYLIKDNPVVKQACSTNSNDGSIELNPTYGFLPFTFTWSNGSSSQNLYDLPLGDYCVTITDALGCSSPAYCYEIDLSPPIGNLTLYASENPVCTTTGYASVVAQGGRTPYVYLWSTGQTTPYIATTATGNYIITVTDACGNSTTSSTYVEINPPINLSIIAPEYTCEVNPTSIYYEVVAQVSGGTPPFSYLWGTGQTTSKIHVSKVSTKTHSLTVTDHVGCQAIASVTTTYSPGPTIGYNKYNNTSFGSCPPNGYIDLRNITALSPYEIYWTGPNGFTASTEDIANLNQGLYCVTITDAIGCTNSTCIVIESNSDVYISDIKNIQYCLDENIFCSGSINLTSTGSTNYGYQWSGPNGTGIISTSQNIENLCPGDYSVTVTAFEGCTKVLSANICCCEYDSEGPGGPPSPVIDYACTSTGITKPLEIAFNYIKPQFIGSHDGSIDILITGGTIGLRYYKWTGPNGFNATTEDLYDINSGEYCVTVSDGCSSVSQCVTLNTCSNFSANYSLGLNCSGFIGSNKAGYIWVSPSGGDTPYTYLWNTGATSAILENLDIGIFTVTISDNGGCTTVKSYTLGTRKEPVVTETANPCRRTYRCNSTVYSEPGVIEAYYSDCNTYVLKCEYFPDIALTPPITLPLTNIVELEECWILCEDGAYGYPGTPQNDYLIDVGPGPEDCTYGDGCIFYDITLDNKFYKKLFVPKTTKHGKLTSIKTNCPGLPGQCYYAIYCGGVYVKSTDCEPCQVFGPSDTIVQNSNIITLKDYIHFILNSTEMQEVGVDADVDLGMPLANYFEFISKKKNIDLAIINKDNLDTYFIVKPNEGFSIYPNPFNDILVVSYHGVDEISEVGVSLINSLGVTIGHYNIKLNAESKTFNIDDTYRLEAGVYLAVISSKQIKSSFKIIKLNNK